MKGLFPPKGTDFQPIESDAQSTNTPIVATMASLCNGHDVFGSSARGAGAVALGGVRTRDRKPSKLFVFCLVGPNKVIPKPSIQAAIFNGILTSVSPRYVIDKIGFAADDDGRIDIRTNGTCRWAVAVVSVLTQVFLAHVNMPRHMYVCNSWQGYLC